MTNVVNIRPTRYVASDAVTILEQRKPKSAASKARVIAMAKDCAAELNTTEDTDAREQRKVQRIALLDQLRDAMLKAFTTLGRTDAEFAISLAFEDVKRMQNWVKLKDDPGTEFEVKE
jgi:hypothetical protein